MRVLLTQPRGKEKLVQAFKDAGAEVTAFPPYDLLIPLVDEELWIMSRLDAPIMCASSYTIDMCRDKAEFYRFCKRHSFLTPVTMHENMVAKPRFGKGSKGIIRLDKSYVVQEDLSELPEVSIDYFADGEGTPISIIPRFRKNVVNGASQEAEFITDMDLTEVTRLGKELGLIGHNVIQGFYTQTQFYFTEVNARFGGGSWLTFGKFNSPKWLTEHYDQFHYQRRNPSLRS